MLPKTTKTPSCPDNAHIPSTPKACQNPPKPPIAIKKTSPATPSHSYPYTHFSPSLPHFLTLIPPPPPPNLPQTHYLRPELIQLPMAKYQPSSIFGYIRGRIGNIIATIWNNIPVLRQRPRKSRRPRSEAQKRTIRRMNTVVAALQPFLSTIRAGYVRCTHQWSRALKYNYPNVVDDTPATHHLPLQNITLSNGTIPFNVNVQYADNQLTITWDAPSTTDSLHTGNLYLAILNPQNNRLLQLHFPLSDAHATIPLTPLYPQTLTPTKSTTSTTPDDDPNTLHLYTFAATTSRSTSTTHTPINPTNTTTDTTNTTSTLNPQPTDTQPLTTTSPTTSHATYSNHLSHTSSNLSPILYANTGGTAFPTTLYAPDALKPPPTNGKSGGNVCISPHSRGVNLRSTSPRTSSAA